MEYVTRFSKFQIGVHAVGALSILLLYFTGFPISFPVALWWIPAALGYPLMMLIHRIAGATLVVVALILIIYHVLNAVFIRERFLRYVLPTQKDVIDAIYDVAYTFRLSDKKPRYDKRSWLEKFDLYTIAIIDGLLMCTTGILLWMPYLAMKIMPAPYLLAVTSVHAAFAVLSIAGVLLHFYLAHLSPEFFPLNRSMFSGEIPREEAEKKYGVWLDEIEGGVVR
jgi:formate dehydrogenase subunit gamma